MFDMKNKLAIFLVIALSLASVTMADTLPGTDLNPIIRVCIIDNADNVRLALKRGVKIYAIDSGKVLFEGVSLTSDVAVTKTGLRVGRKHVKSPGVRVKTENDSSVYVDEKRFRGDVEIIRKENSKLMVINYINLEEYLYGVLYHEVSHRWPMEALKAQAIAARTFALYQARQNRLQSYDLRSDIYSQVYGGSSYEKWSTTKAVDVTKGEVLTFKGDIFPAYYHATCAGYTEDAANLWNVELAPLKGVECNYCTLSPHFKWTKSIPLWELKNMLRANGYDIDDIQSIKILSRNKSGRVDKVDIQDNAGVSVNLTAKDFRQLVGPNVIRSTRFDVEIKWGQLLVNGLGWGHGVGMCQWGVFGMAKAGKKADEILKYYYPGADITTIDKLANLQ